MKILKTIGIILLTLVVIFLILGLVAPKQIITERSIVIDAPQELVFNTVNDFSTWDSWSPWKENDSTIVSTLGEQTAGEGATSSWTSENSGNGTMTITSSVPNERVQTELAFEGMGTATSGFTFEQTEGGVKTTWDFESKMPFPWNVFGLFMNMKAALNKDYDRGLELLKGVVEEKAKAATSYEIKTIDLPARYYIGVRETVTFDKITEFFKNSLGPAFEAVQSKNIETAGMPCGLYFVWDMENNRTDMAGAIPVKTKAEIEGFTTFELPAGKALTVDYYGDYSGSEAAHNAIDRYAEANGIRTGMPVVEEYVTDPEQEPDPSRWLTRIFYPIEE